MVEFLQGKKTYLALLVTLITTITALANGETDVAQAAGTIGTILATFFSRLGAVKKKDIEPSVAPQILVDPPAPPKA